jgi:hypothetical protein
MPSNNTGYIVKDLLKRHPQKIAFMFNPTRWWNPRHQYALDNGAFKKFDEKLYFKILKRTKEIHPPMFIVAPDVVGCHDRTLALWHYYYAKLKEYGYPIAFVAQDGCNPEDVPKEANWIFVGGFDPWKMENIHRFIGKRPVHVGRVNSLGRLKHCESLGVSSIDGTGWLRARDKKFYDLIKYFEGDDQICLPLEFS